VLRGLGVTPAAADTIAARPLPPLLEAPPSAAPARPVPRTPRARRRA
jgi:hypothetical protein